MKTVIEMALEAADELEWMLKSGYQQGREGPPRVHRLISKIKALADQPSNQLVDTPAKQEYIGVYGPFGSKAPPPPPRPPLPRLIIEGVKIVEPQQGKKMANEKAPPPMPKFCKPTEQFAENLYWRLHSLSKCLEGSGRIDEHDCPDAYSTILDAMCELRTQIALLTKYAQAPTQKQEPIKGKNYEQGLWSMRNYEAMIEDGNALHPQESVELLDAIRSEPTELIHKWRAMELVKNYTSTQPSPKEPLTKWQSIENVPKVGTACLVYWGQSFGQPLIGIASLRAYHRGELLWHGHGGSHNEVTHWMPLPPPPTEAGPNPKENT